MARIRTALALTAFALSGVLLTACTAGPDGGGAPTASTAESPAASTPDASPTEDADTAAAACLVGEWAMNQEQLQAFYDDITALMGPTGMVYTPTGSAGLTLRDDGTYSWTPDTVIETRVSGVEMVVTLGGTIDGTYTATDGTIATDNESTDGLEIEATVNDMPIDAAAVAEQIAFAPVANATFTCTADMLTLETAMTLDGATSPGTVTTTLERQ